MQDVFVFTPKLANVIEKSKANDFSLLLCQSGDLGTSARSPKSAESEPKFWEILGGDINSLPKISADPDVSDRIFEADHTVDDRCWALSVEGDNYKLLPDTRGWSNVPSQALLESDKIFVFEFGMEVQGSKSVVFIMQQFVRILFLLVNSNNANQGFRTLLKFTYGWAANQPSPSAARQTNSQSSFCRNIRALPKTCLVASLKIAKLRYLSKNLPTGFGQIRKKFCCRLRTKQNHSPNKIKPTKFSSSNPKRLLKRCQ